MIRRLATLLSGLALALTCWATCAVADAWHTEQPPTLGSDVPVPLGRVYDMKFWAPNRGVLITADGLWAYDGTGWHRLSTVCGGVGGRIAWAGPLDFWTISDQPVGQSGVTVSGAGRSLCHFSNGAVVASYAQPIGQAGAYQQMDAAACLAPDDCWFGGGRLPGTVNVGAFHLHWDGTALTPWPSLVVRDPTVVDPSRGVADFAVHQGALYESVRVEGNVVPNEPDTQPYVLHKIFSGTPPAFVPLFPASPIDYGGQVPSGLDGLQLSSDGDQLWAAAGPDDPGAAPLPPVVLRLGPDGFAPLTLRDPDGLLGPYTMILALAAEPGTDSAWIGYLPFPEIGGSPVPARLARVHADGTVDSGTVLPSSGDGISRKQPVARIACPAPGQCWMATQAGWLFHLGGSLPRDDAPAMHQLITNRPPDAATPPQPPDNLPTDDSGIAPPVFDQQPPIGFAPPVQQPKTAKAEKLVTGVKQRVVKRTMLELRFTLTAKAHVQLVASRRKVVVARTKRATLGKGKHVLRLRLSAKHWPTKLDLRAVPYKAASTPSGGDGADDPDADANAGGGTVTIARLHTDGKR